MTDTITLRKLAEAAPQGKWLSTAGMVYELQHYGWKKGEEIFENRWSASFQTHFDQKEIAPYITNYISAANPTAIIAMLDEIDSLRAALAQQAEPSCPDCRAPGLLYECVHCSASNYPATSQVAQQAGAK